MAQAWQTLEEAALTLGVSLRTLHRRLAKDELVTRLENGRREVLVIIPDPEPTPEDMSAAADPQGPVMSDETDMSDIPTESDADAYSDPASAADEIQHTMLALHEDRIRRTDLAIMAYQQSVNVVAADARRAGLRSRVAWSTAGVLTVALFLAATWATHRVTKVQAEVSHLSANVRQLSGDVEVKSREIKELRDESQAAKLAAARAEGELTAARGEIARLVEARQQDQVETAASAIPSDVTDIPATQPALSAIPATQPSAATQPTSANPLLP